MYDAGVPISYGETLSRPVRHRCKPCSCTKSIKSIKSNLIKIHGVIWRFNSVISRGYSFRSMSLLKKMYFLCFKVDYFVDGFFFNTSYECKGRGPFDVSNCLKKKKKKWPHKGSTFFQPTLEATYNISSSCLHYLSRQHKTNVANIEPVEKLNFFKVLCFYF